MNQCISGLIKAHLNGLLQPPKTPQYGKCGGLVVRVGFVQSRTENNIESRGFDEIGQSCDQSFRAADTAIGKIPESGCISKNCGGGKALGLSVLARVLGLAMRQYNDLCLHSQTRPGCHQTAATKHLIVRVGCQHEGTFEPVQWQQLRESPVFKLAI